MAVVRYENDWKMIIEGIYCSCGCRHMTPNQDIYVGEGLISRLPEYIARRGLGKNCVLACDDNTYQIAGKAAAEALSAAGYSVTLCNMHREGKFEPDERSVGEVLLSMTEKTELLIAVGSGSITDTVRVCAMRAGLPYCIVGTAPSMDGYTSVVAPLILRRVKIHRDAKPAELIVCDLAVLATAPLPMIASGVGDVLGKYIARAEWKISELVTGETYCPVCGDMVKDAVTTLMENIPDIAKKTPRGIKILIEALLVSGTTILMIGKTRAVAGVEHNIAHTWEMVQLLGGEIPPSHGAAVGAATCICLPVFKRFMSEDLSLVDTKERVKNAFTYDEYRAAMLKLYGNVAGEELICENPPERLSDAEMAERLERIKKNAVGIRAAIDELPSPESVVSAMKALGAPVTAAQLGIPERLEKLAMRYGVYYRARYSLFRLMEECGLADKYLGNCDSL